MAKADSVTSALARSPTCGLALLLSMLRRLWLASHGEYSFCRAESATNICMGKARVTVSQLMMMARFVAALPALATCVDHQLPLHFIAIMRSCQRSSNACMLCNIFAVRLELRGALQSTNQIEPSEIPRSSNVVWRVIPDPSFPGSSDAIHLVLRK